MNKETSEQHLEREVHKLAKEMSPKRDLWSGIERAIALSPQENNAKGVSNKSTVIVPTAWAASIVAAVLLTWVSFTPNDTNLPNSINLASNMQESFEEQKQFVLASFGQPELTKLSKEMQTQLTELSKARKAIATALVDDENNSELLNLLRWTQKQELDLLKQLYSPKWQTI